jgi:HEAT repeat protein
MYNELSKTGTIYDYVHDASFPYDQVLQLALTAGNGDPQALPELRAALQADHPVLRYWGAVGCTIRGDDARPLAGDLQTLLRDETPAVRIAAAEALVQQGAVEQGRDALIAVLEETDDDMVALFALNVTAALGLTADIPQAVYKKACATGSYPKRMAAEDYPG